MCGFVAQSGPVDQKFYEAFDQINHRGLRQISMEHGGGTVGHVRLPIVGLGQENDQPIKMGDWLIAFVGEVLDFRDHAPSLPCDLPIIAGGWIKKGPKCMVSHDGFWSIVALHANGDLHVVVDYLAQKPTYYRPDIAAVASEIDPLVTMASVTFDEIYLSAVIKWGYCPDLERTPYNEIKHVLPGEHVCLNRNDGVHKRIVDPLIPMHGDLRQEIERATRRRVLASDVPVACLLSGGLDSSIVYSLASCYGPVKPYYVDLGDHDLEERLAVGSVAGTAKVTEISSASLSISTMECLDYLQEPIDLGSLVPQIALARVIPERVCLTGDGADEAFGGYGRSARYDSQASDLFQELPAWHLPRLDRVMMKHRIEVRSPFLARRVIQIAMALPREMRTGKKILRDIFRDILPMGIAERTKKPLRMLGIGEPYRIHMVNEFKRRHYIRSEDTPIAMEMVE
jgi:asparagine synthase (glutamine-hydrolysing)